MTRGGATVFFKDGRPPSVRPSRRRAGGATQSPTVSTMVSVAPLSGRGSVLLPVSSQISLVRREGSVVTRGGTSAPRRPTRHAGGGPTSLSLTISSSSACFTGRRRLSGSCRTHVVSQSTRQERSSFRRGMGFAEKDS